MAYSCCGPRRLLGAPGGKLARTATGDRLHRHSDISRADEWSSETMTSYQYDVVVVGAGPSGSMTARYAAMGGCRTLLIEKRQEIGSPVRWGDVIRGLRRLRKPSGALGRVQDAPQGRGLHRDLTIPPHKHC